MSNALYYGDNLAVLREHIRDETVDLIYLDPPFNSNASYNVLFNAPSGEQSQAQIEAFEDTWHWNESAERAFDEVVTGPHSDAAIMLRAMRSALGENDMMAYLAMMAVRLIELHRVLKATGSLYLHCDPTASHYLKVILDSVFGVVNFRNDIVWKRTTSHNDAKHQYPAISDTILFYVKSPAGKFYRQYGEYSEAYLSSKYRHRDANGRLYRLSDLRSPHPRPNLMYVYEGHKPHPNGWAVSLEKMKELHNKGLLDFPRKVGGRIQLRRYLDERAGMPVTNVWDDIGPINAMAQERLGYPTQKPLSLLSRIINASSLSGETVLDPFCGCGTTVHAAQKLGRRWIGIDVTHLAIALIERRLTEAFPDISYAVFGVPTDAAGARDLAERDKHEFQKWITAKIGAQPYKSGKKGMDRGIDGYLHFRDADKKPQFGIVSVKGGENITSGMVRDLKGTMDREKAALGLFLTLNEPTREMVKEAASAGFYETGGQKIPRLQILTAEAILDGRKPQVPFGHSEGFRKAAREQRDGGNQATLI
jgi:site-specific DNA-methyltransferase (adenine-specific)